MPADDEGNATGISHLASYSDEWFVDKLSLVADEMLSVLDEKLQIVAVQKLEGFTNAEIADREGKSVATIERYLKMIRTRWQKQ